MLRRDLPCRVFREVTTVAIRRTSDQIDVQDGRVPLSDSGSDAARRRLTAPAPQQRLIPGRTGT